MRRAGRRRNSEPFLELDNRGRPRIARRRSLYSDSGSSDVTDESELRERFDRYMAEVLEEEKKEQDDPG